MQQIFGDHFDGPELDPAIWLPHYLPAWSSRAETAATYRLQDSCLHLSIPEHHPLWTPKDHAPLRVSGIQSGNWSGPLGSSRGQQPFGPTAVVREEQQLFAGWTPDHGYLEMRARAVVSPTSMVAWWLVGLEDEPERCAEICVTEMFGDAVDPGVSAAVGTGLHAFRDPAVTEDFRADRLPIDIAEFHTYAITWTAESVEFFVDGISVRRCRKPPTYPMQMMIAVFDFPERHSGTPYEVPELVVDYLRGYELTSSDERPESVAGQ